LAFFVAEKEYVRLTRPRRRRNKGFFEGLVASRSSLWLGRDHVLNIDSNRYSEEYKRFYFRDIQAITVRATNRRAIWNWILAILFVPALGSSAAYWPSRSEPGMMGGLVVLLMLTVGVGIALLANNLMGPTCLVYIRTAVQVEESPSLGRIRRAIKVLDLIRPRIIAAQGQLAPEEVSARLTEMDQSSVAAAMTEETPGVS
jgi:hypothetical protein